MSEWFGAFLIVLGLVCLAGAAKASFEIWQHRNDRSDT